MKKWWHNATGYQIYPKSYQDTNGDGIGDLNGIIMHLDDLKDLGIDVLWICPVYKSPMMDHGYDISHYEEIDPCFGDMEDMKRLITEAKKRGIRILMDLVVNHTSDQHIWFQEALNNPDSKYRNFYIFKKGVNGEPPNNWRSLFGGSAWEQVPGTDEYYLHVFTKGQPDLNWENEAVREEIYQMMARWMELGLGGFRVDAISHLKKDFEYVNKEADGADGLAWAVEYFRNVDGLQHFLREINERVFQPYDCFTIGEIDDICDEELSDYIGEGGYFSSVFDFCHTHDRVKQEKWKEKPLDMAEVLKGKLFAKQAYANGHGFLCNFIENHDQSRALDRFIPEELISYHSASMLGTVNFFLKGIPFLYQGQEIGMRDFPKEAIDEFKDLPTHTQYRNLMQEGKSAEEALQIINMNTREHSRTPFQWNDTPYAGFSESEPWFEVNHNYTQINYESCKNDPGSLWYYYKRMIQIRKREDLQETLVYGSMRPVFKEVKGLVGYERAYGGDKITVLNNCRNEVTGIKLAFIPEEIILNNYEDVQFDDGKLLLYPFQSLVIR